VSGKKVSKIPPRLSDFGIYPVTDDPFFEKESENGLRIVQVWEVSTGNFCLLWKARSAPDAPLRLMGAREHTDRMVLKVRAEFLMGVYDSRAEDPDRQHHYGLLTSKV
jgi:hypothetical protein